MNKDELELYNKPEMQKLFREKMGPLQKGDKFMLDGQEYFHKDVLHWLGYSHFNLIPESSILLPLPIDPKNPERGIAGMLDNVLKNKIPSLYFVYR